MEQKANYRKTKCNSKFRTILGGILFHIYIASFILVSILVDKFLGFPKLLPTPLNIIVSVPILAIGVFLMVWAILQFVKAKGTPVPLNPPPKLVTTGPYAYIRNPQGTSWFILFIGFSILFQSISLVFIFTPLFFSLTMLNLKKFEEPALEKRFGKEWIEYKQRVPIFIPRLRGRT